ncbi:MAG: hypothetical protein AB1486_10065 [Planctomycetota bacterium]
MNRYFASVLAVVLCVVLVGLLPQVANAQPKGVNDGWQDDGTVVRLKTLTDWVGIGTASPATRLHVLGTSVGGTTTSLARMIVEDDDFNVGIAVKSKSAGSGYLFFSDADAPWSGFVGYGHGADFMTFNTAGLDRMVITGTGNVGIATMAPGAKLEVNGEIASIAYDPIIRLGDSRVTENGYLTWSSANTLFGFGYLRRRL